MLYYKANSDIKGNTNYKHLYSTNFEDLPIAIAKGQIITENELKKLFYRMGGWYSEFDEFVYFNMKKGCISFRNCIKVANKRFEKN